MSLGCLPALPCSVTQDQGNNHHRQAPEASDPQQWRRAPWPPSRGGVQGSGKPEMQWAPEVGVCLH